MSCTAWKLSGPPIDSNRGELGARIDNRRKRGAQYARHDHLEDLRAFAMRGGRLLMYHGWNDQLITAQNSVNYYESVRSTMGAARTDATMRLFMAPGMAHCAGGPGPNQADWLAVLEQWVERGVAPSRIEARTVNGAVVRTRPLCAYPQVAHYSGKGSTDDAANFTCGP